MNANEPIKNVNESIKRKVDAAIKRIFKEEGLELAPLSHVDVAQLFDRPGVVVTAKYAGVPAEETSHAA